jgi:hypothetical protein
LYRALEANTEGGVMTEEERQHLEEVQGRLRRAAEEGNADAGDLAGHVDAYLAGSKSSEDHDALVDRLRDGVRRFEAGHPTLSQAVQGVIDSLTASGI